MKNLRIAKKTRKILTNYFYLPNMSYDPAKNNLSVIAAKSFGLGAVILISLVVVTTTQSVLLSTLGFLILFLSIFHFGEFLSTSLFQTLEVDDDSFILEDGDLHIFYAASIVEILIRHFAFNKCRYSDTIFYLGFFLAIMGQAIRSLAMYTAKQNFSHYIQRQHNPKHQLVTSGIYSVLRHPSYFGWFYWIIGVQLVSQNIVCLGLGVYKIWWFFNQRIEFEEGLLVEFFKEDYEKYRKETITGIPLIP